MNRTLFALPALFLAAAAAPVAAQAQGQAEEVPSKAELQKTLDDNYARMDSNKDGNLTRAEVEAAQSVALKQAQQLVDQRMAQEFAKLDANKDGQVSLAEFTAATPKARAGSVDQFLQRFDGNKDGKVSPAEYKSPMLAAFDRVDSNKDGVVSPQERQSASR